MGILSRVANIFRRDKLQREIEAELAAHLAMRGEDNLAAGMSAGEAKRDARLRFGNVTTIGEQTARVDATLSLESAWFDLRYGFRQLRNAPGFAAVTLITLALGIGANTAIFSLINAALLKMLPVNEPQQLVEFTTIDPQQVANDAFSYPAFQQLRDRNRTLSGVMAFRRLPNLNFEVEGQSDLANGQLVSGNYFTTLGVKAILGRTLLPSDEAAPGENTVAVLGYDYWRSRFALDPAIVGKTVLLNNAPYTVIGVTQPEFYGLQPGQRMDVSVPITTTQVIWPAFAAAGNRADVLTAPFRNWLYVMGRLRPGISRERALANLQPLYAQSMREAAASLQGLPVDSPTARQSLLDTRLQLEPGGQGLAALRRQFSKPLWIVMAIVGLLLLVTCANVANLQLARATARQREIAVRLMIGASRMRLIRQLLIENLLLAIMGGALGLGMAFWGTRTLMALLSHARTPMVLSVRPDATVLGFTIAVSLLTALFFGIIPTWRATRLDMIPALAQSARSVGNASNRSSIAKSLVVLQIAISLILAIGAGLLSRSLKNLKDFYPGFNKDNVLLFSIISPQMIGYNDAQSMQLYQRLLDRLQAVPGVRAMTSSMLSPLSENHSFTAVDIQGYKPQPNEQLIPTNIEIVRPGYFHAMEIALLQGRDFTANDRDGAPKVAVVNQNFARRYFGDSNPIGRQISIPGWRGDASWIDIVGVSADVTFHDLRESSAPGIYLPELQQMMGGGSFELRTSVDAASLAPTILNEIHKIDSRLPVFAVKTLSGQLDDSMIQERLVASLSGVFGALALALAAVGLYGLMTYSVNRRTPEIGIRMALGAERGQIALMVLRETLLLLAVAFVIGLPAALVASRLVASQLYGLKPYDPATLLGACLVLGIVALAATYLPARRAASVEPIEALRSE